MGTRNPELVPMKIWRGACETVAQMMEKHWAVIGRCTKCQLRFDVDLKLIAAARGQKTSLWNKRGRCKVVGCGGAVKFMARPPACSTFKDLEADWPDGAPGGNTGYDGPR